MTGQLSVKIVGRGRVGHALARSLRTHVVRKMSDAVVVVLAVPDPKIPEVARAIAPNVGGKVVLHCAGSLTASVLEPCRAAGAHVGVMHPLASFADRRRGPDLGGVSLVIAGDRKAVAAARRIAKLVGARPLVAEVHGPAYHAAAALAANGAAAFASIAVQILTRLAIDQRDAERAIGALLTTVGENVERVGVPAALTGPIVRGEPATVRLHRDALAKIDPDARAAYDAIAPAILECAIRAGLPPERAEAIRAALDQGRRGPMR
jgi:predicted short-subunit dehydrogenase-like oxidoreductase (DUF2520 family)